MNKLGTNTNYRLAAFLGLILVFLLYQGGGGFLTIAIFGMNPMKGDPNALRLLTMAGQILFILLPALVLTKRTFPDVTAALSFRTAPLKEIGFFTLGFMLLSPILEIFLFLQEQGVNYLAAHIQAVSRIKYFLDQADRLMESSYSGLMLAKNPFEIILVVLLIAVTPAICEETFFRGYVQSCFAEKSRPFRAALFTAVFFGIYHMNPYGTLPLIAIGLYLGYARYRSDSILVPVVLHFLNNLLALISYFIFGHEDMIAPKNPGISEIYFYLCSFIILLAIFFGVIFLINKYYRRKDDMPEM